MLSRNKENARNDARCMQAMKAKHGLDGKHQDVDRWTGLSVEESIRMTEKVRTWCGHPCDRGRLKNRTAGTNIIISKAVV